MQSLCKLFNKLFPPQAPNLLDDFFAACAKGDLAHVRKVAENWPRTTLGARGAGHKTALHFAAENGRHEVVAYLLELGADESLKNNNGETALQSVHAFSRKTRSLLQEAELKREREHQYQQSGKFLMNMCECGGSPTFPHSAAEFIKFTIGAFPEVVNFRSERGNIPLVAALSNKNLSMARFLIDNGADINLKGRSDRTALWYAAYYGSEKMLPMVRELVERGADLFAQENESEHQRNTVLQAAIKSEHAETVAFIKTAIAEHIERTQQQERDRFFTGLDKAIPARSITLRKRR